MSLWNYQRASHKSYDFSLSDIMLEKLVLILSLRMRFFEKCYCLNEVYSTVLWILKSNANLHEDSFEDARIL